jgi:hypothetical protein
VGVLGASAVVLGFISLDVWGTLFEVGESIKVTLTFCFRRREELRASMLARHYYRKDTSLHFHSDTRPTRSGVQGRMLLFSGVGTHGLILFPSGGLGSCRPVLLVPGVVQEGVMRGPVRVARLERYSGGRSGYKLKLIPNNEEKYISFSKILRMDDNGYIELRFIDSFRFLASGLDNLLSNLESSQLTEIIKYFSNHKLDMLFRREKSKIIRKGIYPYEYMDSLEKFSSINR